MARNILLFMDGTRNKPSDERMKKDSNVLKAYRAFASVRPAAIVKYVRGVGTDSKEKIDAPADDLRRVAMRQWHPQADPVKRSAMFVFNAPRWAALNVGGSALGWGVADRIVEGYEFLCRHYRPGDAVYLFGFSRGAYEARSLAGFVDKVGLLLRGQGLGRYTNPWIRIAYDLYRGGDEKSMRKLQWFLRRKVGISAPIQGADTLSQSSVAIHFVGVWDTVAALGAIGEPRPCDGPKVGRMRGLFPGKSLKRISERIRRLTSTTAVEFLPDNVKHGCHAIAAHELRRQFEPLLCGPASTKQSLKQVWFAGAHADVGGGYAETHLSDIALEWMMTAAYNASRERGHSPTLPTSPKVQIGKAELIPHHEIQGWFALFPPKPRSTLRDPSLILSHSPVSHSVHRSALVRLLDSDATTYGPYPFEDTFFLKRRFPDGVAIALSELDDHLVALHVRLSLMELSRAPLSRASGQAPPSASPPWRDVKSVEALRAAASRVDLAPFELENAIEFVEAVALLWLFEQRKRCEDLRLRLISPRGWPKRGPRKPNATRQALLSAMNSMPSMLPSSKAREATEFVQSLEDSLAKSRT